MCQAPFESPEQGLFRNVNSCPVVPGTTELWALKDPHTRCLFLLHKIYPTFHKLLNKVLVTLTTVL